MKLLRVSVTKLPGGATGYSSAEVVVAKNAAIAAQAAVLMVSNGLIIVLPFPLSEARGCRGLRLLTWTSFHDSGDDDGTGTARTRCIIISKSSN